MISSIEQKLLEGQAIEALRTCYDPEIPVNIYDLGLIYEIKVSEEAEVTVTMTLTSPHCPVAQILPSEVEGKMKAINGVKSARVNITWDPPWNPSMMTESAKLELGFL